MPSLDRRSAGLAQLRPNNQRKISGDRSESENDPNSPRKFNRYPNERSLSPKSPRSSEESFPKYQRFNRNTNRDDDDNHNKSQPITPRSARSDRDELGNLDMMRTMRKPLSDTLTKSNIIVKLITTQKHLNYLKKKLKLKQSKEVRQFKTTFKLKKQGLPHQLN